MKNPTHYFLLLLLLLPLLLGGIFLCGSLHQESLTHDVEISSHTPSTNRLSFPEPAAEVIPPVAPSIPVSPASTPATINTASQPLPPGTEVLTIPGAEGDAAVPAAFGVPYHDPNLNSDQMERINAIIENFTHEMNSGNTNPDDPAYLARWQKAQADADDRLRLVLGQEDYLKYMLAAGTMDTSK